MLRIVKKIGGDFSFVKMKRTQLNKSLPQKNAHKDHWEIAK